MGADLLRRFGSLANAIVLAEAAVEVAAGEEEGAGTVNADQRLFLPEMGSVAGDPGMRPCRTETRLSCKPVDSAATGTKSAVPQFPPGGFGPLVQEAAGVEGVGSDGHGVLLFGQYLGQVNRGSTPA